MVGQLHLQISQRSDRLSKGRVYFPEFLKLLGLLYYQICQFLDTPILFLKLVITEVCVRRVLTSQSWVHNW